MDRFAHCRNIERYANQLEADVEPIQRPRLMRLLIEEEDRLGQGVEALELTNRRITSAREMIVRQQALISRLALAGLDISLANLFLTQLLDLLAIFEDYRDEILDGLKNE